MQTRRRGGPLVVALRAITLFSERGRRFARFRYRSAKGSTGLVNPIGYEITAVAASAVFRGDRSVGKRCISRFRSRLKIHNLANPIGVVQKAFLETSGPCDNPCPLWKRFNRQNRILNFGLGEAPVSRFQSREKILPEVSASGIFALSGGSKTPRISTMIRNVVSRSPC